MQYLSSSPSALRCDGTAASTSDGSVAAARSWFQRGRGVCVDWNFSRSRDAPCSICSCLNSFWTLLSELPGAAAPNVGK